MKTLQCTMSLTLPRKEILDTLKCGACCKYLSHFPIYISDSSMSICGRCSPNLVETGQYIHNTSFELIVQSFKFPCIYENVGCSEYLSPDEVPLHEKSCQFRLVPCISPYCNWEGTCNDFLQHIENEHNDLILRNLDFEVDFSKPYEECNILIHDNELFRFVRKFDITSKILWCSLSMYGLINPLQKYNYEIVIENGARTRKVNYSSFLASVMETPRSVEISSETVMQKLEDPSFIIGSIKISNDKADTVGKPAESPPNPEINVEMLEEMECPVCLDPIPPPIYQCVTGHIICGDCKSQVTECPTCKQEIQNTQNFTLEKIANFLLYPCKFQQFGCNFAIRPHGIKDHQKYCTFGPKDCPLKDYEVCQWKNATSAIYPHVKQAHHDSLLEVDTLHLFMEFGSQEDSCYITKYEDKLFKLHFRYLNETFYWAMQLIGPPEESLKHKFEIDIIDISQNQQRLFLRSYCSPLTDKAETFINPGQYVYLKLEQVRAFITGEELSFRVRITK